MPQSLDTQVERLGQRNQVNVDIVDKAPPGVTTTFGRSAMRPGAAASGRPRTNGQTPRKKKARPIAVPSLQPRIVYDGGHGVGDPVSATGLDQLLAAFLPADAPDRDEHVERVSAADQRDDRFLEAVVGQRHGRLYMRDSEDQRAWALDRLFGEHARPQAAPMPEGIDLETFAAFFSRLPDDEHRRGLIRQAAKDCQWVGRRPSPSAFKAALCYVPPTGSATANRRAYADWQRFHPLVQAAAYRAIAVRQHVSDDDLDLVTWNDERVIDEAKARALTAYVAHIQRAQGIVDAAVAENERRRALTDLESDGGPARDEDLSPVPVPSILDITPTPDEARAAHEPWQRRQIRDRIEDVDAHVTALLGLVGGAHRERLPKFVSHWTLHRHRERVQRNEQCAKAKRLAAHCAMTGLPVLGRDGKPMTISLYDAMVNGQEARKSQLYAIIKGIERIGGTACPSRAPLYVPWFITLTLPGRYHANAANGNGEGYDLALTPKEARAELMRRWHRVCAALKSRRVQWMGVWVKEPHGCGCPHLHVLVWILNTPGTRVRVKDAFLRHFPREATKQAADGRLRVLRGVDGQPLVVPPTDRTGRRAVAADTVTVTLPKLPDGKVMVKRLLRRHPTEADKAAFKAERREANAAARIIGPYLPDDAGYIHRTAACEIKEYRRVVREDGTEVSPAGYIMTYVLKTLRRGESVDALLSEATAEDEADATAEQRGRPEAPDGDDHTDPEAMERYAAWATQRHLRRFGFIGLRRGILTRWRAVYRQQAAPASKRLRAVWNAFQRQDWARALLHLGALWDTGCGIGYDPCYENRFGETTRRAASVFAVPASVHRAAMRAQAAEQAAKAAVTAYLKAEAKADAKIEDADEKAAAACDKNSRRAAKRAAMRAKKLATRADDARALAVSLTNKAEEATALAVDALAMGYDLERDIIDLRAVNWIDAESLDLGCFPDPPEPGGGAPGGAENAVSDVASSPSPAPGGAGATPDLHRPAPSPAEEDDHLWSQPPPEGELPLKYDDEMWWDEAA